MKTQIVRLSPHQNGKVTAVLMAVVAFMFAAPITLIMLLAAPDLEPLSEHAGPPPWLFLIFPFLYLIVGYLTTVLYCAVYNFLVRFVGGFEFEGRSRDS